MIMAMKKRFLGCLAAVGMMLSQVMCAGATEGSKGAYLDLSEQSKRDGYLIEVTDTAADKFFDEELFGDLLEELKEKLGDRVAITPVLKIDAGTAEKVPSSEDPEKEVYEVSLYIPFLNEVLFENDEEAQKAAEGEELTPEQKALLNNLIALLYFGDTNWDDAEWDTDEWLAEVAGDGEYSIISYIKYDLENCTVTFEIEELPVCMVLFAEVPEDFELTGVSPETLGDFN